MKPFLISLLLFACIVVNGQTGNFLNFDSSISDHGEFWNKDSVILDTIPCLMLVSDTSCHYTIYESFLIDSIQPANHGYGLHGHSVQDTTERQFDYRAKWMKGYDVTDIGFHNNTTLAIYPRPSSYQRHQAYLSSDKKPLTYFVWQSKQL